MLAALRNNFRNISNVLTEGIDSDGGYLVPEEYEIRDGAPEYTGRICVIGSNLKEEKLEELFLL